jgi:FkbM family methyltransferase
MSVQKVTIIFDNQIRPDTTGGYCLRALGGLAQVTHFLPSQLEAIPRQGIDLYLNIDDGLEYWLPKDLHPCAWWAIDTHLNLDWCLKRARDFDFIFAAQRDGTEQLQKAGLARAFWLPLACDPEIHRKHDVAKEFDVAFVGHLFPGPRAELVDLIQRRFRNSFVGQRFFEEMARTYSAARIVFNRSIRNDINMRVFEALACGSLLLTNDLADNGQEDLFRDGAHLATYRDAEEMLDKIAFYLARESVRERIAAAGRAEVLAKDTYRHRMELLLSEVERGLANVVCVPAGGAEVEPALVIEAGKTRTDRPAESVAPADPTAEDTVSTELMARLPDSAGKFLVIGHDTGPIHRALQARQGAEVVAQAPEEIPEDQAATFDAILCLSCLEYLAQPLAFLRRARNWLRPEGQFLAVIPTIRRHGVLRALLEGSWVNQGNGHLEREPVRCFTRREIEKLFYRAGFSLRELGALPGPGHADWDRAGRPGEVKVGGLHIGQLPLQEAEEFFAAGYLVHAVREAVPDYGLTSIIILTYNQLVFTRRCLDSIRRYTDEPYELIVVDNASTDGTVDYLGSLPGVQLIRNAENRGFPAAANQGIQVATGRQVLLLNNDTVVTTGWLRRLLQALAASEQVGLAGPCSNFVSGPQQVAVSYDDLDGLEGFAWDWGQTNAGQRIDVDRLVGFCLLIRREVVDKVGLLDEQFGIGCFEDDDYCRRALQAGYRAVIARDAFVHHFGGQTFRSSGIDFAALMTRNQELFQAKWAQEALRAEAAGATAPAAYRVRVASGGELLLERKAIQLSLCMIVRDNARTLEACLKSIRPWVDEMVVVDTGSQDDTPRIARDLGARVFHFPWCDSFAAARNESLRHARGRWIFWMDSDDVIDEANGRKLRALVDGAGDDGILGYVMQVHCPGPGEDGQTDVTVVDHVKLFRNLPALRFERRIHEQIIPAIRRLGGDLAWTDIFVVHAGYDHSPEGQRKKLERDLRLLNLELQEEPEHPFTLFNLGMTHADVGEHERAVDFLRRCIRHSGDGESHLRKAYALLVGALFQLRQGPAAWDACQEGLRKFPLDAELRFRKAILLHYQGRLEEAVQTYQDLLQNQEERHFASVDRGITGYIARHNLALVYEAQGDLARAEAQWRLVVTEMPRYRPGWEGLSAVLRKQGKTAAARAVAERLEPWKAEGEKGALGASEALYRLELGERVVEIPLILRGEVDRAILCQIWEKDAYGIRAIRIPPKVVLDVGAHIGLFTLMAGEMWPEARVIACEADPENFALLRRHLADRRQVEAVEAAILGEGATEVAFYAVMDKVRENSGGGSCLRPEPGSKAMRVPAMSVVELWRGSNISRCDLLKLDCEGAEVPILKALGAAGLLEDVGRIVGEWHAEDDREQTCGRVKAELKAILRSTHEVAFKAHHGGREGYFTAQPRVR